MPQSLPQNAPTQTSPDLALNARNGGSAPTRRGDLPGEVPAREQPSSRRSAASCELAGGPYQSPYGPPYGDWKQNALDVVAIEVQKPRTRIYARHES